MLIQQSDFVEQVEFCGANTIQKLPCFIYGAGEGNRTLVVSLGSYIIISVFSRVFSLFSLHKIMFLEFYHAPQIVLNIIFVEQN